MSRRFLTNDVVEGESFVPARVLNEQAPAVPVVDDPVIVSDTRGSSRTSKPPDKPIDSFTLNPVVDQSIAIIVICCNCISLHTARFHLIFTVLTHRADRFMINCTDFLPFNDNFNYRNMCVRVKQSDILP